MLVESHSWAEDTKQSPKSAGKGPPGRAAEVNPLAESFKDPGGIDKDFVSGMEPML